MVEQIIQTREYNQDQRKKEILEKHGYVFLSVAGSGTFATCFRVLNKMYQQVFIAKILSINSSDKSDQCFTEVHSEIDCLIHISHPNVIRIYEYFQEKNLFCLILEYCGGGSVEQYINKNGPLPRHKLIQYAKETINALDHIHSLSIAHRDLKPGNILIDSYGRSKLADFGLSQHLTSCRFSQSKSGSLAYVAPEVLTEESFDPFIADIWSLGITFYVMACGRLPWKFTNSREKYREQIVRGEISYPDTIHPDIKDLLNRMIQVKPSQRTPLKDLLKLPIFFQESRSFLNLRKLGSLPPAVQTQRTLHFKNNPNVFVKKRKISNPQILTFRDDICCTFCGKDDDGLP